MNAEIQDLLARSNKKYFFCCISFTVTSGIKTRMDPFGPKISKHADQSGPVWTNCELFKHLKCWLILCDIAESEIILVDIGLSLLILVYFIDLGRFW